MRWWKILGLAGLAGVAATGVITVQQDERRRRAYTPEEVRARLHERVAPDAGPPPRSGPADDAGGRSRIRAPRIQLASSRSAIGRRFARMARNKRRR